MRKDDNIDIIINYLDDPQTVDYLAKKLGVSKRSIYRYFKIMIDDLGVPLKRAGMSRPTKYYLDY